MPSRIITDTGSQKRWQKIRLYVLRRDAYRCYMCNGRANEVDHVIPRAHGGTEELSNLKAACKPCNSRKASRMPNGSTRGMQPKTSRQWI